MSQRRRGAGPNTVRGTNRPGFGIKHGYRGCLAVELRGRGGPMLAVRALVDGEVVAALAVLPLPEAEQRRVADECRQAWSEKWPGCVVEVVT